MPGYDRVIDPITRDYVSNGRGGYEKTRSRATACYHQLRGNFGQWALDPAAGSLFFLLERAKSLEGITTLQAIDYARLALKGMLDAGELRNFKGSSDRDQSGRIGLRVEVDDVQYGTLDLSQLLPLEI